jgi:cell division protein FtsL
VAAYIHGNLAVEQRAGQKVKIKETRKVVVRNKALPVQEKLLYLFIVVIFVAVAGAILWRYAQIYQMNKQILLMQQQIRQVQAENSALKQEVEKLQSNDRLREQAMQWGFVPPEEAQPDAAHPNGSASASKSGASTKPASSGGAAKVAMNQR